MTQHLSLAGSICNPDAVKRLQQQSPDAMLQWLLNTLLRYLQEVDDEDMRLRYISYVWWLRVLHDPTQLRQFVNLMGAITCTSDPGLDTAIGQLSLAKLSLSESNIAGHNTHWLNAVYVLDELPGFLPASLAIAEEEFNRICLPAATSMSKVT